MAKFFTPVQINEFKECFSLYDKKQKGKIDVKDLITVMRCLGTSPTLGEIQRHLQAQKIEKTGEVDFSMFLMMMHRQMKQEDPKKEILEALRMTDKQKKGYIQASELRAKLTKLGEKLTNKEDSTEEVEESRMLAELTSIMNNSSHLLHETVEALTSSFSNRLLLPPLDDLFKEANIKSNGIVNYEEFTQMVMLPPVDY